MSMVKYPYEKTVKTRELVEVPDPATYEDVSFLGLETEERIQHALFMKLLNNENMKHEDLMDNLREGDGRTEHAARVLTSWWDFAGALLATVRVQEQKEPGR